MEAGGSGFRQGGGGSSPIVPDRVGILAPLPRAGASSVPTPPHEKDEEERLKHEVRRR